jgi:hypothetical protein
MADGSDSQAQLLAAFEGAAGDSSTSNPTDAEDLVYNAESAGQSGEAQPFGDDEAQIYGPSRGSGSSGRLLGTDSQGRGQGGGGSTPAPGGGGSGGGGGSIAGDLLALVSMPVAIGLAIAGLFEGSGPQPEPLTKYAMPDALDFSADDSGGRISSSGLSYDQQGNVRDTGSGSNLTAGTPHAPPAPPGSAIDLPGLLKLHSTDVADAVRTAILNSHPLNDAIRDL